MKAKIDTQKSANNRAVSSRLHALWWRPSADRKSVARPRGSVPKRGRHSSRSAAHQSCAAQRVSRHPFKPLSRSEGGARRRPQRRRAGDAMPRAGRPHVEPTDVYSCPPQEGGYSARGSREGESKEGGVLRTVSPSTAPTTKPMVWRHGPRLDMEASGLTRRSAQHLTPLRGRPPAFGQEAMEREGAEVEVQRPKLRTRACKFGPDDPTSWSHPMAT